MKSASFLTLLLFFLAACSGSSRSLGLAGFEPGDLLPEYNAGQRAYNARAQAPVINNDLAQAERVAAKRARRLALDQAARELLSPEAYNKNFKKIWTRLSRRPGNLILQEKTLRKEGILDNQYAAVSTAFVINRGKLIQVLQKELKVLDQSHSSIIVLVESPEGQNLDALGYKMTDLETGLLQGLSAKLYAQGFSVMDYQNLLSHLSANPAIGKQARRLTAGQYFELASKPGSASGKQYAQALAVLQGLAKVIIKLNIEQVGYQNQQLHMALSLTAVNISTLKGGAMIHTRVRSARYGGSTAQPGAMIAASIDDLLNRAGEDFIPQITKEFNIIDQSPGKLLPYQVTLSGYDESEVQQLIQAMRDAEGEDFRLQGENPKAFSSDPPKALINLRVAARPAVLSQKLFAITQKAGVKGVPPLIEEGLLDLILEEN